MPEEDAMALRKKIVLAGIAAAVAAAAGCGLYAWQEAHQPKPSIAWGSVDAREVSLAFEAAGRIAKLEREEGEPVRKGERLAELDVRLLRIEIERSETTLAGKEAHLRLAEEGYRKEEIAEAKAKQQAAESNLALLSMRTAVRLFHRHIV